MNTHAIPTALRRLALVRHGETTGQSSIRYYGSTDVPLSEEGQRQMERARDLLEGETFDRVYTSRLSRTVQAAQIIAPRTPAVALDDLNEIHFGDWEGLTREEIRARDPEMYDAWQASRHEFTYPNGDAVSAFRSRVAEAFRRLLPTLPARTLMVVHRGIVSTILGDLLGIPPEERPDLSIELGSVHVLEAGAAGWSLAPPARSAPSPARGGAVP